MAVTEHLLLRRARRVWEGLAGAPVAFGEAGLTVVASGESQLCPPGWAGIVALGDAAIATTPGDPAVLQQALHGLAVADLTDPDVLRERLPVADVLGPATLAYRDGHPFEVPAAEAGNADELVAAASPDDAGEAGLDEITSPAFVVREDGRVVAAAGYQLWPGDVAHLCVLTAAGHRGRGLARTAAGAAVAHALGEGLLPQWRARPEPSRRVAVALGFTELGSQLSVQLPTQGSAG